MFKKFTFIILASLISLEIISYGFFISQTVKNVGYRGRVDKESKSISIKVGEIESKYADARNSILKKDVSRLGFIGNSVIFLNSSGKRVAVAPDEPVN